MTAIEKCFNIADLRRAARRALPSPMFHYIDGGADDEATLRRNADAFAGYDLIPSQLNDVANIDLSTELFGARLALPFILSPTGMSRLFHHGKELAAARAAARHGALYSLSTLGTTSLEEVAAANPHAKMFQIYILKDRGLTRELVERCKAAKYTALCLTVDTPVAGNRERDLHTGMVMPPRFGPGSLLSFASHPYWSLNFLRDPDFTLANVAHRVNALGDGAMGVIDYINSQFDRTLTWRDAEILAAEWGGPFVIKGLQSAADARRARDIGATAVMISNHGGRQLDGAPAPVDCIRPMRDAVGGNLELIVDGGVRRGSHVVRALALGADACSIGRPYLYGLAAAGEAGVSRAIEILKTETERTMALLGCSSVAALGPECIMDRSWRAICAESNLRSRTGEYGFDAGTDQEISRRGVS
jgi:L-lactate dehydrogenase (cytochrome)